MYSLGRAGFCAGLACSAEMGRESMIIRCCELQLHIYLSVCLSRETTINGTHHLVQKLKFSLDSYCRDNALNPLVQIQPDAMGMSTGRGSPDWNSLPPAWDPPGPRTPLPWGSGASPSPGDISHSLLNCLPEMGPFLTGWKGLTLTAVESGYFL